MMSDANDDHGYSRLDALKQACDDEDIEEMDQQELQEEELLESLSQESQVVRHHTPVKSPDRKKLKTAPGIPQPRERGNEVISNSVLYTVIMKISSKLDSQGEQLHAMEWKFQENTDAVLKVKESVDANTTAVKDLSEEVNRIKSQVAALKNENTALREMCLEHARYKRKWNLRLNGVPEKEGENTREVVISILKEVVPLRNEQLQYAVDTVHRLGQKGASDRPRQIIIQFALRTVCDLVWKMSKDARICREKNIRFKQDFCKEDRESRLRLWPRVEEARKKGVKAYLKDGYAVIEGRIIKN